MNSQNPVIDLMRLIGGFQVSQAISVTAELGIADVLKNDALHIDAIAQATECHPRSLYRLLHMLASAGVLEELTGQHFKLTPLGECLRSDSSNKRSAWARYAGQPYVWQSWGAMMHSVKTGESSFGHLHGANLWEWRSKRREETEIFDAAMSELSSAAGKAVASSYDFSVFNVIIDVGGERNDRSAPLRMSAVPAPQATRKQAIDLQAAILVALRKRKAGSGST